MSLTRTLPPEAWRPAPGGGVAAEVSLHGAGGVAVMATGWADPAAARLLPPAGAPLPFAPLGEGAFLAAVLEGEGGHCLLEAPAPPAECRVRVLPRPAASSSLALLAPRALRRPPRQSGQDAAEAAARITAALAEGRLEAALAAAAELLLTAREAPATREAVAAILAHLAHHPLRRSPALGAFVAALMDAP
jgi:hypothetical protein